MRALGAAFCDDVETGAGRAGLAECAGAANRWVTSRGGAGKRRGYNSGSHGIAD